MAAPVRGRAGRWRPPPLLCRLVFSSLGCREAAAPSSGAKREAFSHRLRQDYPSRSPPCLGSFLLPTQGREGGGPERHPPSHRFV